VARRNPYYRGERSDHFDGVRFHSPAEPAARSWLDLTRMYLGKPCRRRPRFRGSTRRDVPPERVEHLRIASIGHASILIQLAGLNLLVDPVWAERASPVAFAGPKRVVAPGIAFDDLPPIDAVLVTHNHYDHLDGPTIARLWRRFRPRVIAPLGNDTIIRRYDPSIRAEAYDWGDRVALSEHLTLHLEPAFHWSGRGVLDRRMALWGSFVLRGAGGGVLYHVGDTAYGDGSIFRRIRDRYGPPDVALLPIGGYEPRWFMQAQHVDPQQAVRIMLDCRAARAFGHHWGTFRLTHEALEDPVIDLAAALAAHGVPPERFQPLRPGQTVDLAWT
jgi:L-ascorbate metabolism protein UlaG (beta-lactamase superfamily)